MLTPVFVGPATSTVPSAARSRGSNDKQQRRIAVLLAVLMHLLLLAFLVIGISWQTRQPEPVQAELWIPPPAPVAMEPKPVAVTAVPPAPAAPPKPVVEQPKVDIALERERKLREEKKLAKQEEEKKLAAKLAAQKLEKEKIAKEKELADKASKDKLAKEKKAKEELKLKEEQKLAKDKAEQLKAEQLAAQQREDYLKRLRDQTPAKTAAPSGNTGSGTATGTPTGAGAGSGTADADYVGRISAALRANTNFNVPLEINGNPKAVFTVLLAPDCGVVSVKLKRSSGLPAWDTAAERGISRTDPFPRPRTGNCERELEIARGPRDDGPR